MEGGWHGAFAPPSAIPGWNPAGGGGRGLLPPPPASMGYRRLDFRRSLSPRSPGWGGEGLVPSPGPKQWGCAARVSPSSYVTACSCHGHGGGEVGVGVAQGAGMEAWRPPAGAPSSSPPLEAVYQVPLEPRVLTSGDRAASSQSVWASACWSVKQTHCIHDLGELGKAFWSSVLKLLSQGLNFQKPRLEAWDGGSLLGSAYF